MKKILDLLVLATPVTVFIGAASLYKENPSWEISAGLIVYSVAVLAVAVISLVKGIRNDNS